MCVCVCSLYCLVKDFHFIQPDQRFSFIHFLCVFYSYSAQAVGLSFRFRMRKPIELAMDGMQQKHPISWVCEIKRKKKYCEKKKKKESYEFFHFHSRLPSNLIKEKEKEMRKKIAERISCFELFHLFHRLSAMVMIWCNSCSKLFMLTNHDIRNAHCTNSIALKEDHNFSNEYIRNEVQSTHWFKGRKKN